MMPEQTARNIAELRRLLNQAADHNRTPEEWLVMAVMDGLTAVELAPVLRLAEPGSAHRSLMARHVRFLIGKTTASLLESLKALEQAEGLAGPIGEGNGSHAYGWRALALAALYPLRLLAHHTKPEEGSST
jgi:hypothetical protein